MYYSYHAVNEILYPVPYTGYTVHCTFLGIFNELTFIIDYESVPEQTLTVFLIVHCNSDYISSNIFLMFYFSM